MPAAVEELIRWISPVTHVMRTCTEASTLGDHEICPGDISFVIWNGLGESRQRRSSRIPIISISRELRRSITSPSAMANISALARTSRVWELRVFLEELMARRLKLELTGEVERSRSNFAAGIRRMPVVSVIQT